MSDKYRGCIWFDGNAGEAAQYYADVFPGVTIDKVSTYPEGQPDFNKHMEGKTLLVELRLDDQRYIFLNAGPEFPHNENFSIEVMCEDQAEVDRYWDRLVGEGGQEGACGWCKDKFGVSWQIVPARLYELLADPATEQQAMAAMLQMKKIIVADLESAVAG